MTEELYSKDKRKNQITKPSESEGSLHSDEKVLTKNAKFEHKENLKLTFDSVSVTDSRYYLVGLSSILDRTIVLLENQASDLHNQKINLTKRA